jgi:hypothetical protein
VVAGTHIQEQAATKSALTKVDCPVDAAGDVDFDKAENGNLTCPLTGTNLDQVQALKLKNSENRTDTNTASGTVSTKTSGTSKTTQAVFTLASLGALPAKLYKVYTENTDGTEGGGDLPLNFSGDPYLPASGKPSPAEINLADVQSSKDGVPVTLSGYHLDQVQSVQFAGPANGNTPGPAMTIPLASGSTATTAKVAITAADLKKANITGQMALSITLVLKAAPAAAAKTNKQTLSLTGKPSAAPAPPPPATAKITFAPPSGKAGKPVKITGTGLKNTTSVKFGGVAATSMNVDSDTQVTATVPAGAKTGKIVLTINGSPVTSTKNFTVQ